MKKILSLLVVLTVCIAALVISASAAVTSGTCGKNGELNWSVSSDGHLSIGLNYGYMEGKMKDYRYNSRPWSSSGIVITSITVGDGITNVGASAFSGLGKVTEVRLPDTLKTIDANAFDGCWSLTGVKLPEGVTIINTYAFRDCTNLTELRLPSTLKYIYNNAFDNCWRLPGVVLPEGVTVSGDAFADCIGLTDVTFCGDATGISSGAFSGVTAVGWYPKGNSTWANVEASTVGGTFTWKDYEADGVCGSGAFWTLEDGLLRVFGEGAMHDYQLTGGSHVAGDTYWRTSANNPWQNSTVTGVIVEEGVKSVGAAAFAGLDDLATVTLNEGLKSIGRYAFNGDVSLRTINIPDGVESIGNRAFGDCANLALVCFEGAVPAIDAYAFSKNFGTYNIVADSLYPEGEESWTEDKLEDYGAYLYWAGHSGSGSCGDGLSWALDEDGTLHLFGTGEMEDYAAGQAPWYALRENIKAVEVWDGVESIGAYAFDGCTALEEVFFPDDEALTIGTNAFRGVSALCIAHGWPESARQEYGGELVWEFITEDINSRQWWTLNDDGVLEIYGNSELTDMSGWSEYADSIKKVYIQVTTESIPDNAFSNCPNLTAAEWHEEMPITEIGDSAFEGTKLAAIDLSGVEKIGSRAFYGTKLTEVDIPETVGTIYSYAFAQCAGLEQVTLSEGVRTIAEGAFANCGKLTGAVIPNGVTMLGTEAFANCGLTWISLPDNLTYISSRAFIGNKALGEVLFPAGVGTVGSSIFEGCTALKRIMFNGSVPTNMAEDAFSGVTADCYANGWADADKKNYGGTLTWRSVLAAGTITANGESTGISWQVDDGGTLTLSGKGAADIQGWMWPWRTYTDSITRVVVSEGITALGDNLFNAHRALTEVVLPENSLETIGDGAFLDCTALKTIEIPACVTSIGASVFNGCTSLTSATVDGSMSALPASMFEGCTALKSVNITAKVTEIGELAFGSCSALTTVKLPDTVETFGRYVFDRCAKLSALTLPNSTQTLGVGMFARCEALTEFTIPNGVTVLPESLFNSCTALKIVNIPDSVRTMERYVFSKTGMTEVNIPAGVTRINIDCFGLPIQIINFEGTRQQWESAFSDSTATLPLGCVVCCGPRPEVSLTVNAANGKPKVTWKAMEGAEKYEIWRATSKTGEYTKMYTTTGTSYTNTSAYVGKAYYYKVRAVTGEEPGCFSIPKYVTCDCARPVTTLKIKTANGKPQLTWEAVTGASKYEVWRAVGKDSGYTKMLTTTGTVYTNTSAEAGKTYYYKVRAICSATTAGNSAFSAAKYITCDCAQPVTTLKIKTANGKPQLTWEAVTGASKYEVWRAVGKDSGYTKMLTTTGTVYTNTSAEAGETYYYKVRAICKTTTAGNSAFSAAKYITCDCAQPVVSITLNANNKPKLSWEKVAGASKYEIWRAVGQNSGYKKIYTMTGNVFTNSSVEEGETYYYKVRAVCGATTAGNSAFSAAKSVTVPVPLNIVSQPEDASAAVGGKAKFTVEAEGTGLTYQWQYCTATGSKWSSTTLTGNKTATLTVGVTAGRNGYKYRCVVTDVNGDSVTSDYGVLSVK